MSEEMQALKKMEKLKRLLIAIGLILFFPIFILLWGLILIMEFISD
jgi:membrane protein insertase Oxa1/YidC/SpoIIIJ